MRNAAVPAAVVRCYVTKLLRRLFFAAISAMISAGERPALVCRVEMLAVSESNVVKVRTI